MTVSEKALRRNCTMWAVYRPLSYEAGPVEPAAILVCRGQYEPFAIVPTWDRKRNGDRYNPSRALATAQHIFDLASQGHFALRFKRYRLGPLTMNGESVLRAWGTPENWFMLMQSFCRRISAEGEFCQKPRVGSERAPGDQVLWFHTGWVNGRFGMFYSVMAESDLQIKRPLQPLIPVTPAKKGEESRRETARVAA